jgi:hypothetical protein
MGKKQMEFIEEHVEEFMEENTDTEEEMEIEEEIKTDEAIDEATDEATNEDIEESLADIERRDHLIEKRLHEKEWLKLKMKELEERREEKYAKEEAMEDDEVEELDEKAIYLSFSQTEESKKLWHAFITSIA